MKLVVNESSEKRRRRQDFPTPADMEYYVQLSSVTVIKMKKKTVAIDTKKNPQK